MKVYQIKESTTRGKIVVAVRDIMPGELVVEEKEPILYFTHAFYSQFDAGYTGLDKVLPAFSVFSKQLTSEKQHKLLTLFGPTTGQTAESIRNYASKNMKYRFKEDEEPRSMNSEELELFVKVAQVVRLNIFGSEEFGYAKMSQRYSALHVVRHAKEFEALLRELLSHKFPRRHAAVLPLLKLEWRIKYKMFHNQFCSAASVHASLSGHIAAMENILRYPHSELLKELKFAVEITTNARLRYLFSPKEEKELCQKTLRMHLLIHGRNRREEALLENPLSRYDAQQTGMGIPIPAFSMFMKHLSSQKQRTLLSLYGPTTGNSAESVRNFARKGLMFRFREDEEHRNLTLEEAEIFVKVAQVVRLNVFGSEDFGYS
eukprot:gene15448-17668_t